MIKGRIQLSSCAQIVPKHNEIVTNRVTQSTPPAPRVQATDAGQSVVRPFRSLKLCRFATSGFDQNSRRMCPTFQRSSSLWSESAARFCRETQPGSGKTSSRAIGYSGIHPVRDDSFSDTNGASRVPVKRHAFTMLRPVCPVQKTADF